MSIQENISIFISVIIYIQRKLQYYFLLNILFSKYRQKFGNEKK